ncbi:methyl-accepting chemotaxis protein [Anaerotruncus sp.]|uniref:methyl-accepting chemotaxis protein n=1 Tax=Anaerotruncus TaxID=244127 RepID=UPI002172CD9B|nr:MULTISPECIES: methyl-accepting chemotaxis protein [Anaerotruncus]MCI8491750.1 methyl-accepting chemotaxis protein [Anaerotruncus sp.]
MRLIENKKLAVRIGVIITSIILVGMLLLWLVVSTNAASIVKNDITNQMTDAVESRAAIIHEYVLSAEEYMTAFALGSEVRELLLNPDDPALLKQAQKYTEDFAAVKDVFEGLYIATPTTHVLTHTSQGAVGMTTRSGESLKTFQDTILSQRELTNLGIMKSPGTGSMILSMYYPVFEGEKCIGYVGAGVYASHLMDSLLNLDIKGLPGSEYVFLNVDTGVYLYHENDELLNTETTDAGYQEIIRRIQAEGGTEAGTYSYRDENGVRQLVVYKYLEDRGWVFMVRDHATEVYGSVTTIRVLVGVLCAVVVAAVILVTLLILRREGRDLMMVEQAIGRLGELNLSADQELEVFYGRSDEIGIIAQTTHHVCGCLRKTIDDVGRILGEIANGNLTVDVLENESYYIGDFKALFISLQSIHTNLLNVIRDISQVAGQVNASAERVSSSAQVLAQGAAEQSTSVDGLAANVNAITAQLQTSTVRCSSASDLVGRAAGYAAEADVKMEQLTAATRNIDQSSSQIGTINKTIGDIAFQTNILALNAAVEAARAGSAGKGFSVVADEVRNLAAKSAEAAQNTNVLISQSIESVKSGTESTDMAVSAMHVINDCVESIKELMDEIAAASVEQSEMIASVENGIREISAVVQTNSAAAEKSAAVSKELSQQARALNSLIGRFRIQQTAGQTLHTEVWAD